MIALPDFIGGRLKPLSAPLAGSWRLWQYKSLNLHRGVIHWDATALHCTLPELRDRVRGVVSDHFRPSWWRGFGFGVIISVAGLDASFDRLEDLVDTRNNRRGVWQWLVLHVPAAQTAIGMQTWTEGFLAPIYGDLIAALQASGVDCSTHRRDVDPLIKKLQGIHEKLRAIELLGEAGRLLP